MAQMTLMCIPRHTFNLSILNQTKGDPKRMRENKNKNKNTTDAVNSVSAFQAELKVRMS